MQRHLIILKGFPNSGKSTCLRDYLPPLLGYSVRKKSMYYEDLWILILRRSIHESPDWKQVLDKIIVGRGYDLYIVAAWEDECVSWSSYVNEPLEQMLDRKAPGLFKYHIVHTSQQDNQELQIADQKRCAREIKNILDSLI